MEDEIVDGRTYQVSGFDMPLLALDCSDGFVVYERQSSNLGTLRGILSMDDFKRRVIWPKKAVRIIRIR